MTTRDTVFGLQEVRIGFVGDVVLVITVETLNLKYPFI